MKHLACLLLALACSTQLRAVDHAVVLVYHHVSKNTPALTSVTPEVFESHLNYLDNNGFSVWPLTRILATLAAGEALPDNTVAITFDDAYESVYREAFPRLQKRNWPFTLFVASEPIDSGYAGYLGWPQLRILAKAGVELGNHSHSHGHLVRQLDDESDAQWRRRVTRDIDTAAVRLREETGSDSKLFAYPYGEHSPRLKQIVAELGYQGIAQQSGAVGAISDFLVVPRFPMASGFADLKRFATAVNSRPLPVTSAVAGDRSAKYQPVETLQLTLAPGDYRATQLACYRATGKRLDTQAVSDQPLILSIPISGKQNAGRHKINCTAPASSGSEYFWYSFQWLVKNRDGSWYRE